MPPVDRRETGRPRAPYSIGHTKRCLVPSANRPLPPRRRVLTRRHALTLPLLTLAVGAAQAIDTVSARLGIEELRALNARSTEEKVGSGVIASDWLKEQGLVGG